MIRVIGRKILGIEDPQTLQASSSPSGIDLGIFKSEVKFSNVFNLNPKMLKNVILHLCYVRFRGLV